MTTIQVGIQLRLFKEALGICFGYALAHFHDFYDFNTLLIMGRVTSGPGGAIMIAKVGSVLCFIYLFHYSCMCMNYIKHTISPYIINIYIYIYTYVYATLSYPIVARTCTHFVNRCLKELGSPPKDGLPNIF